jgi:hypothetical protein
LGGKPKGKRPLGTVGRVWEDNIGIYLKEKLEGFGLDKSGSG